MLRQTIPTDETAMFSKSISDDAELQLIQPHHAEELYSLVDANREHLRRWLPWVDSLTSVDMERDFIQASLGAYARDGGFTAGIWYRGHIAGVIGLNQIDWTNRATNIGYWLGEIYQGRGLIALACQAIIDYSVLELKLNRVSIHVATENYRSQAIPKRLGFKEEGTLRQVEWLYDRHVDHIIFGMLAQEWHELAGISKSE
tara:strand:- start:4949 stop:5551 length:603 start_codon:yes stop_codon:yes gene_type:complete